MLRWPCDSPGATEDRREDLLTERQWQRIENTMRFVVEQQAIFESNFARADRRFAQAERRMDGVERRMDRAERRMDRLERFADRVIRAGEQRMARAEAETADLRADLKSFLQALRRSAGDGRGRS